MNVFRKICERPLKTSGCTNTTADAHKHWAGGALRKRRRFTGCVPSVWSRRPFDPTASEATDWKCYLAAGGGEPQTTNMHQPKQDLFFFGTVEQQVVVTCSWPAVRVKSSKWSSATRWQQNGPLIRIKQSHVRLIGPCRIFSPPLLLNSKHQAAARKSSRLSLLRLEAKCFTV